MIRQYTPIEATVDIQHSIVQATNKVETTPPSLDMGDLQAASNVLLPIRTQLSHYNEWLGTNTRVAAVAVDVTVAVKRCAVVVAAVGNVPPSS